MFRRSDIVLEERYCSAGETLLREAFSIGEIHGGTALAAALASILGADCTIPTMSKATIIYKRGRDSRKMRKFLTSPLNRKTQLQGLFLIIPIGWKIGENLIQWLLSHDKQLDASLVVDGVVVDMSVRSYLFHCFESY